MAPHDKEDNNSPESAKGDNTGANAEGNRKSVVNDNTEGGDKKGGRHADREGESQQSVPSGRPMRQTCMVARDHILAWRLQQQWSFRAYAGAVPDSGSKARKATKAASATRKVPASKKAAALKKGKNDAGNKVANQQQRSGGAVKNKQGKGVTEAASPQAQKRARDSSSTGRRKGRRDRKRGSRNAEADAAVSDEDKAEGEQEDQEEQVTAKKDGAGSASGSNSKVTEKLSGTKRKETDEEWQRRKVRVWKEMEVDNRIARTLAIAEKGMKETEWPETDKKTPISFMLCPADQSRQENSLSYMGRLRTPNLSTPPEATVLHLKRFLISKLLPHGSLSEIQIVCRGLILHDDKTLYTIKHLLWPKNHSLDPVLRFRRVVKGDPAQPITSAAAAHGNAPFPQNPSEPSVVPQQVVAEQPTRVQYPSHSAAATAAPRRAQERERAQAHAQAQAQEIQRERELEAERNRERQKEMAAHGRVHTIGGQRQFNPMDSRARELPHNMGNRPPPQHGPGMNFGGGHPGHGPPPGHPGHGPPPGQPAGHGPPPGHPGHGPPPGHSGHGPPQGHPGHGPPPVHVVQGVVQFPPPVDSAVCLRARCELRNTDRGCGSTRVCTREQLRAPACSRECRLCRLGVWGSERCKDTPRCIPQADACRESWGWDVVEVGDAH